VKTALETDLLTRIL